jgi:hypothetical protein
VTSALGPIGPTALAKWLRTRGVDYDAEADRRGEPRPPLDTDAVLIPVDPDGRPMSARRRGAVLVDISGGGARLVSRASMPLGPARALIGPRDSGLDVRCKVLACTKRAWSLYVIRVQFEKEPD